MDQSTRHSLSLNNSSNSSFLEPSQQKFEFNGYTATGSVYNISHSMQNHMAHRPGDGMQAYSSQHNHKAHHSGNGMQARSSQQISERMPQNSRTSAIPNAPTDSSPIMFAPGHPAIRFSVLPGSTAHTSADTRTTSEPPAHQTCSNRHRCRHPRCRRVFSTVKLKRQCEVKHGLKWKCPYCPEIWLSPVDWNFKRHMKDVHGISDPPRPAAVAFRPSDVQARLRSDQPSSSSTGTQSRASSTLNSALPQLEANILFQTDAGAAIDKAYTASMMRSQTTNPPSNSVRPESMRRIATALPAAPAATASSSSADSSFYSLPPAIQVRFINNLCQRLVYNHARQTIMLFGDLHYNVPMSTQFPFPLNENQHSATGQRGCVVLDVGGINRPWIILTSPPAGHGLANIWEGGDQTAAHPESGVCIQRTTDDTVSFTGLPTFEPTPPGTLGIEPGTQALGSSQNPAMPTVMQPSAALLNSQQPDFDFFTYPDL